MTDESELNLTQASNNSEDSETRTFTDVLKTGTFTNILESSSAGQKSIKEVKYVANDFESLTAVQPIPAVSVARCSSDHEELFLNPKATNEEDNDCQENEEYSRSLQRRSEDFVIPENSSTARLVSNTAVIRNTSHFANKTIHNYPEDQESKESDVNGTKVTKRNFKLPRSFSSQTGPRSSSPIVSDNSFTFEGFSENFEHGCEIQENISTVNQNDSTSIEDVLSKCPDVPHHDPTPSFGQSSIDGGTGSVSDASSSMSRSYMYSSVSVDIPNPLQSDGDHLIPKYKADGTGFCWPMNKLPLSGDLKFEENKQWMISNEIGYGASGMCFQGYPVHNKDFNFCVKKCKYKKEEVKALFLAAKDIHEREISRGASKIVLFYGALYYKPDVCIFMEYMKGGTVNDAINEARKQNKDGLDKTDCVHYLEDVLLALEFLHSQGLVHNDIKANNVLLSASKFEAKLCDFGKAAAIDRHNSPSRDIQSAGCFLLEMLGKKYSSAMSSGILKKSDVLERLPTDVEQDTRQVLSWCFSKVENVCTASYILQSTFFNYNAKLE